MINDDPNEPIAQGQPFGRPIASSENSASGTTSAAHEFDRTRNSYEQTMMSWIRTATSLITFGFSIYKFFQLEAPVRIQQGRLIGPREFALILVSIGVISLPLATLEYRQSIRALGAEYSKSTRSLSVVVAALISLLGVLALLAMIFRQ
jgi:inner membrane protein YidH